MPRQISRAVFVVMLAAVAVAGPLAHMTLAGGGCHRGATQGKGDTVEMAEACFTPSVLRTEPGTQITFVNTDPFVHNVGGGEWGHFDDLAQGDAFTASFAEPGVYPFACTYHPGMTGAIVVGDGTGAGSGRSVTVASASRPIEEEPAGSTTTTSNLRPETGPGLGWLFSGAVGLVLGTMVGLISRRRPGRGDARQ
jgi:plastocyanin